MYCKCSDSPIVFLTVIFLFFGLKILFQAVEKQTDNNNNNNKKTIRRDWTDTELTCRRKPTPISHKTVICCKVESECYQYLYKMSPSPTVTDQEPP